MDFLKSAITSIAAKANTAFPYASGEKVEFRNDTIWTIYHGTRRSDNLSCTIFEFDINSQRSRLPLARNAAKKLRTLRFPGVIKVLDTYESDSFIYIATEHVVPLDVAIQNRDVLNDEVIKWGLYAVANTVQFINVDASSIHGNIRHSSIFIADSGEWKLSGFEVLTSTKDEDPVIYTFCGLLPEAGRYASPEIAKSSWDILKKQPHDLFDSWLFGALIFELFNGAFSTSDQLQSSMRKKIPSELFGPFKKLVQEAPRRRASVKQFVEVGRERTNATPGGGFFITDMIALSESVDSLSVQSEYERETFLKDFQRVRHKFPPGYLRLKILPELVKCFEFGSGGAKILAVVLDISENMSSDEFQVSVAPSIVKMFSSPDRAIRLALLESLPKFIEFLPSKLVNDKLFPDMLTGFTDVAPALREQTVKAVLVIISKLNDRNINNDLLRHLAKTQNDEQPGIRTNTTICLGKIAHNLGPHTRSRVLITAFTRSLRDPFVHARNAALMALAVTVDIFSPEDCCNKLLPALCPSLLDREKLIRTQAHKTLEAYLAKVHTHAATMPDAGTAQPLNSAPASLASTPKPQENAAGQNVNESSWTGWAINGFTKRLGVDDESQTNLAPSLSDRVSTDSSLSNANATAVGNVISPASSVTRPSSASSSLGFLTTGGTAKFEPVEDDDEFGWGGFDDTNGSSAANGSHNAVSTEEGDWAAFDEPIRSASTPARSTSKPTPVVRTVPASSARSPPSKPASTARTVAGAQKRTGTKSHSIAAHKEQKKKESLFADTGANDDDGWGDGW
ncbi:armadillo-type protein [Lipomyces kononenkoae]